MTWWTFRIFLIFSARGEGKGEFEAPGGGGGRIFIENPRRGGSPGRGGEGGRGAGRVSARNSGGGGAKYFFSGPKRPPRRIQARKIRTGLTITSQKRVEDEKVYKPHFSPELGGFHWKKVGEFRLNPGSRTKFANLPVCCDAMFGPPLKTRNPNPNFLVWNFPVGWGVFHVNGWGPKSSLCPSKHRETKLLGGISRDLGGKV